MLRQRPIWRASSAMRRPRKKRQYHWNQPRGSSGWIQPLARHTDRGWLSTTPKKLSVGSRAAPATASHCKPALRKLVAGVGHVFTTEDAEAQQLGRRQLGWKAGSKFLPAGSVSS